MAAAAAVNFYQNKSVLLLFSLFCQKSPECRRWSFSTNLKNFSEFTALSSKTFQFYVNLIHFMLEPLNKDHVWCGWWSGGGAHADGKDIKGGVQSHPSFHFDDNTCSSQAKWFWVKYSIQSNDVFPGVGPSTYINLNLWDEWDFFFLSKMWTCLQILCEK